METRAPRLQTLEHRQDYGKFIIEPLERGYAVTLGNPIRRVLLASLQGAAVTAVNIDGAMHEFATLPGVREDVTQLILNLGSLAIKVMDDRGDTSVPYVLRIDKKGEGVITGADIECPADVEIVNPETYIATLTDDKTSLSLQLMVERGAGYVLPNQHERYNGQIGVIPVGSAFSPVKKVNFAIEQTRVGSRSDFERLIIEVWTNGTLEPRAALQQAADQLSSYIALFRDASATGEIFSSDQPSRLGRTASAAPDVRIEELDFTVRTYNCLKKANYQTVADLVNTSAAELLNIRNLGNKSLHEVQDKLRELGYTLTGAEDIPLDED